MELRRPVTNFLSPAVRKVIFTKGSPYLDVHVLYVKIGQFPSDLLFQFVLGFVVPDGIVPFSEFADVVTVTPDFSQCRFTWHLHFILEELYVHEQCRRDSGRPWWVW